ncbi:sulfotransferase domain-containing protein [Ulvibacter sp. MAR_2010_11]|uniref:sulfotransferase domain-containing protein n=1 Tax=Ulvibacter sp. MAR_2010_11 TaxID=1250229 RepID=UPI000C2C058E|nr:sulfotransferase domain-containing protein [Ulvibacter sp. MAR_2010_11]PKA82141.1 sulfotransferase domain-containing protein [Ulvibacter sp. MAR_2010_11]
MIVISAGMQKSGSAYIYNLINDAIISTGYPDARKVKDKYRLNKIMKWHNNNIGPLEKKILIKLVLISLKEGKFVVKTHSGPSKFHNILLSLGIVKTVYIYRDPRDALLSAQEHGKKIIENGDNHTFAQMVGFNDAFDNVKSWTNIFKSYKKNDGALLVRYEDLMDHPLVEMQKICRYLNLNVTEEIIEKILVKYDRKNPDANMTGLHFNKGVTYRYRNELTEKQIDRFSKEMGIVLEEMGYEK